MKSDHAWLAAGTLLDGTGGDPQHDMAVRIERGRIAAVVPRPDVPAGAPITDLGDVTVIPGLVDAHVHLLFTCDSDHERTRRRFVESDEASLREIGTRNAAATLRGGVTTVRDLGDTRGVVATLRDAQQRGDLAGPRIRTAGAPLTTPSGHLNWCGNVAQSDAEIVTAVNRLADAGMDVLKIMASGGNMTAESDPLASQFSDDQLALAVKTAHDRGLTVAAHAQNVASISGAVRAGVDTIEHCLWRHADGSYADPQELIDLLQRGTSSVMLTFAGIQRALTPANPGYTDQDREAALGISPTKRLDRDFAWARELRAAGVPVAVASDAGVRFTPFDDFVATVRATMVALQVSAPVAVSLSTSAAARAIGLDAEVGRIAPGLRADLAVLDGGVVDADDRERLGPVTTVFQAGVEVSRE